MTILLSDLFFVAWALVVAVCDCRNRRIPNSLVVTGLVAAFVCASLFRGPFDVTAAQAALGFAVGLAALMPFFALGVMGAADVKVFAVLGAWCGMHGLLYLWMAASLAAAVHAICLLIVTRTRFVAFARAGGAPTFALGNRRSTPYAACLVIPAVAWLALQTFVGGLK